MISTPHYKLDHGAFWMCSTWSLEVLTFEIERGETFKTHVMVYVDS